VVTRLAKTLLHMKRRLKIFKNNLLKNNKSQDCYHGFHGYCLEKSRTFPILSKNHFVEAPSGFEPLHRGFADLSLSHLGTTPLIVRLRLKCCIVWDIVKERNKTVALWQGRKACCLSQSCDTRRNAAYYPYEDSMNIKIILRFLLILLISALFAAGKEKDLWKDLFLKTGDIKIHYIEAGSGDRTLVFITGWTMPAEIWREQIPYFASRGFRVIAFDPRSQGLSSKTDTGNTYQQQAADLHAFLQGLQIEHSYLVGWSSGVTVLLEYLSSPETIRPEKIVFVDGGPAALKMEDYPGSITNQQARKLLLGFQDDRVKATEQFIRGLFKTRQPETLIKELIESSHKTPLGAAASLYFDLFTGDRRSALMHIEAPSLIITTPENQAVGEYMKNKTPRSSLEVIEGAGTAMFLEKPQAFNQILETFLGDH
jgi:non-heme chloroperoxidase